VTQFGVALSQTTIRTLPWFFQSCCELFILCSLVFILHCTLAPLADLICCCYDY